MNTSPRVKVSLRWITLLLLVCLSACGRSQGDTTLAPTAGSENIPEPSPVALAPSAPDVFVFSATLENRNDLFLSDMQVEMVKLFSDLPNGGRCPAFSPDGAKLAFCSNQDGEDALFISAGDGAAPHRLADQLSGCGCSPDAPLAWSPDGKWISLPVGADKSQAIHDIYVVRADNGQATNLTDSPQRYGGLVWDPDSQSMLIAATVDGQADIYRMDIESKTMAPLTSSPITGAPTDWSRDGRQLLYYADSGGGNFDIFLLPSGGGQPVRLTDASGFDSYPVWFPDGQQILFVSTRDGDQEIYSMHADGSNQVNLTNNPGVMDIWPSLSLDGQQIIYLTNANNQWDCWIMNADGSNRRKITDRVGIPAGIAWKP